MSGWLACGVRGHELDADERRELAELAPGGIVLFARNVRDREQLAELVAALHELPGRPYVAIDLEGGRVNRLRCLIGELPAPARAAAAGAEAVAALGDALGAACAHFAIDVDFAPVVDVDRGGYVGGEGRCLGTSPAAVVQAASRYLAGIERFGVATCLKHYPGLGSGPVDSHHALPELGETAAADEGVFQRLTAPGRAVMVAHAMAPSLGEAYAPASLSRTLVGRLAGCPCGPVIADDLEMGALGRFGSLPERAAAALGAGCHQVLVCNALAMRRAVVEAVRGRADDDPELAAALRAAGRRLAAYGRGGAPAVEWGEVLARAARARELAGVGA
ncbi:MAG TPA: glycoside hydrolase family 3 N-terminal domain-containing protein [Thermoanaerobaculaceae bacterium]|nr:glycoside hydrolase family 3 N-terminal domain-containing protein [Thermoanaerobaculaceae bacterium]HRS15761.1 glycoside hydrolase family 3 N-terminal domain-containing protein [Thermoanaerobaculaceae bacterium]